MIRGTQLRSLWTAAPYSIKRENGREVEVQSLRSQPDERFLVYPFIVVETTHFWRNLQDDVGTGIISFVPAQFSYEYSEQARNRMRHAGTLPEDMR